MDMTLVAIIIQLIFLEGILSIDNAAVLGTMVSVLPDNLPVPWPRALKGLGRRLNPLLGNQRGAALRVGLLGAYLGRGLMLLIASFVIQNPWLKLLGAFYLVRLAFENLGLKESDEGDEQARLLKVSSFWLVVFNVEMADLVFSLDNVVAAVSLSDKLWVVMLGVALGIVTMRFAAGFFSYAVVREPVLKVAAYILVLNIGIQLILEDLTGIEISDWTRFALSIGIILFSLLYAHSRLLQRARPVLTWAAQGCAKLNELIDWLLVPVIGLFQLGLAAARALMSIFAGQRKELGD